LIVNHDMLSMVWLHGKGVDDSLHFIVCISVLLAVILAIQVGVLKKRLWQQQNIERELRYYSEYDILTSLKNRNAFSKQVQSLDRGNLTVLVCDIDGLKIVNDTLGHWAGDQLIRQTAEVLKQVCPSEAQIFRMGGDEFLIVLPESRAEQGMALYNSLKEQVVLRQKSGNVPFGLSIGVASGKTEAAETLADVIRQADCAMYQEKRICQERVRQSLKQALQQQ